MVVRLTVSRTAVSAAARHPSQAEGYADTLADIAGESLLDVADAYDLARRWPRKTSHRLFKEALERHYRDVEWANKAHDRAEAVRGGQ